MTISSVKDRCKCALQALSEPRDFHNQEEKLDSLAEQIKDIVELALTDPSSSDQLKPIESCFAVCIREKKFTILKPIDTAGSFKTLLVGIPIDLEVEEPPKKIAFLCSKNQKPEEIKTNETEETMLKKFKDLDIVPSLIECFDIHCSIPSPCPSKSLEPGHRKVFVEEFCEGGDLSHLTKKTPRPDIDEISLIAYQILSIVKTFHDNKLAIRDLKPENFLRPNKQSCKIKMCDLGMVDDRTRRGETIPRLIGTPLYISPESVSFPSIPELAKQFDLIPSDIWACGITIAKLLYAKHILTHIHGDPFPSKVFELFTKISHIKEKPPIRPEASPIEKLTVECLDPNPKTRPTASALLQSHLMVESLSHNLCVWDYLERGWINSATFCRDLSGIDFEGIEQEYVKEAEAVLQESLLPVCFQ